MLSKSVKMCNRTAKSTHYSFDFIPTEIDIKRGQPVQTFVPTPRRRSDSEFMKWDSEVNAILDDDYEGEQIHCNHSMCLNQRSNGHARK